MTAYEAGFHQGEHQAFKDRRNHIRRERPDDIQPGSYVQGFWDGYTPRNLSWLLAKEPKPYWAERESEVA